MNKFLLILSFLFGFLGTVHAQQTGAIKGKVLTSDGIPAEYISVAIVGTGYGTVTNAKGEYRVGGIKAGNYVVKASAVGALTQEQQIIVNPKETTIVDFSISYSSSQLKEVNIRSGRTNKFAKQKSEFVSKIPLNNLENPQVYNTVTSELMTEQLVMNQDQAVQNVPGLYRIWNATNRSGDGGSYYTLRGFTTQSLIRNGIAGRITTNNDAANLERIESIKGPSGALFGGITASYGGLINRVTKQPLDSVTGEVSYMAGSYGKNRLTVDFNSPVNKEKTALFRLNAAYDKGNSFQDFGFSRSIFLAPSFSYQLNDKVKVSLEAELQNLNGTTMPLLYIYYLTNPNSLNIHDASQIDMNWKRSYTNDDLNQITKSASVFGKVDAKLSENWSSQTVFSTSNNASNGIGTWLYLKPNNIISRNAWYVNGNDNAIELQHNFNGDVRLAGMRHRLLGGVDALLTETKAEYKTMATPASPDGYQFDEVNYTDAAVPAYAAFNKTNVEARMVGGASSKNVSRFSTYSVYVADVINITDNLLVNAGVRFDYYYNDGTYNAITGVRGKNVNQSYFSPKFGLVYQILKDKVSAFGNYQNGFRNITTMNPDGSTFDPEKAEQFEGGFKFNVFSNKISANVSYYDIKVSNVVIPAVGIPNTFVQDGTGQRSKGFEGDISANPVAGLNLLVGYAYNDSKLQSTVATQEPLRPITAGPQSMVNFWGSYTFETTGLKGLGFGFGGNYASETYAYNAYVGTAVQSLTLPSYTVLNTTVFYNTGKFRIAGKLDNLTNKKYWNGYSTINIQSPRTFVANIAYKF